MKLWLLKSFFLPLVFTSFANILAAPTGQTIECSFFAGTSKLAFSTKLEATAFCISAAVQGRVRASSGQWRPLQLTRCSGPPRRPQRPSGLCLGTHSAQCPCGCRATFNLSLLSSPAFVTSSPRLSLSHADAVPSAWLFISGKTKGTEKFQMLSRHSRFHSQATVFFLTRVLTLAA